MRRDNPAGGPRPGARSAPGSTCIVLSTSKKKIFGGGKKLVRLLRKHRKNAETLPKGQKKKKTSKEHYVRKIILPLFISLTFDQNIAVLYTLSQWNHGAGLAKCTKLFYITNVYARWSKKNNELMSNSETEKKKEKIIIREPRHHKKKNKLSFFFSCFSHVAPPLVVVIVWRCCTRVDSSLLFARPLLKRAFVKTLDTPCSPTHTVHNSRVRTLCPPSPSCPSFFFGSGSMCC